MLASIVLFARLLTDSSHSHAPVLTRVIGPGSRLKSGSGSVLRQIFLARYGKDSQSFKHWRNKVQRAIKSRKEAYYTSKVKNLKETRVGKWWKEIKDRSGVSERETQWYSQLVDGANVTSVTKLCECINDFFASLTAGFTPLSPSEVSDIHVDIKPTPPPPIFLSLCAKPTSPCGRQKSRKLQYQMAYLI